MKFDYYKLKGGMIHRRYYMNFWYIIIAAIILILLFPYIRLLIKRVIMSIKIKKICKRKKFRLYGTHLLWMFGRKNGRNCDLYIETPIEILSIKLFETLHYHSIVYFTEHGTYFVRRFIGFIANTGSMLRMPIDGREKKCQLYNFRRKFQFEWEIKTPKNILLFTPVCYEIRKKPTHGEDIILGAGELINGMEIESLSRFIGYLEGC